MDLQMIFNIVISIVVISLVVDFTNNIKMSIKPKISIPYQALHDTATMDDLLSSQINGMYVIYALSNYPHKVYIEKASKKLMKYYSSIPPFEIMSVYIEGTFPCINERSGGKLGKCFDWFVFESIALPQKSDSSLMFPDNDPSDIFVISGPVPTGVIGKYLCDFTFQIIGR